MHLQKMSMFSYVCSQRDAMKVCIFWYKAKMASIHQALPPFPSLYIPSNAPPPPHTQAHFTSCLFTKLLYNSKMNNNGGAADKGKRKMSGEEEPSEGGHQTNLFHFTASSSNPPNRQIQLNSPTLPTNTQLQFPSSSLPPNSHFSQVQQILNNAAPRRPFSYMSLLTAPDEEDDDTIEPLFQDINNQRAQIDQIVTLHVSFEFSYYTSI